MARRPRIDAPGIPQHVIQRGVNRCACFHDDLDREFYLAAIGEVAGLHACSIHAYVLMTNHVHLLVTGQQTSSVSAMMQSLGRRYVRRFNNRHGRSGTLWEGRFKSSLVDSEQYLLTCYRYIEMNPVRARMVADPGDHAWSRSTPTRGGSLIRWCRLTRFISTWHGMRRSVLIAIVNCSVKR